MSGTGLAQTGTNNWSSLQGQGCLGRVLGMYNSNSSVVLTAVDIVVGWLWFTPIAIYGGLSSGTVQGTLEC